MEKPNTHFLIRALKSSDVNSFERIYKLYYSKLYWFSKRFHCTTMDSDDFVQQTFLKLWENRDQLKDNISLDQQIFIMCKNLAINYLKKESRIISKFEENYLPTDVENNSEVTSLNPKVKRLKRAIEQLPPKRKNVFILHKIDNLTYEEISKALGISKKTIANHIYLANNYIKEELL